MPLTATEILGNPIQAWLIAAGVSVGVLLLIQLLTRLANRRGRALKQAGALGWPLRVAMVFGQTRLFFMLLLALYLGSLWIELPQATRDAVNTIAIIGSLVQVGFWGSAFIRALVRSQLEEDPERATTLDALEVVFKVALWAVVLLLALDNIPGIEINTLIASLGIGGVAAALAVQNVLGDLFASLSIALDRPFKIGDFIIIDEYLGTIEDIGLRSTRIQSLTGERVIFSNSDLLNSRIRNYQHMAERRVVFKLGVTYNTPHAKLAAIPGLIEEIVSAQETTRFDRAHFKEFGDSCLLFEAVYYVLDPDYNLYMDRQQAINLALARHFEEQEIEFAFPTRTIFMHQAGSGDPGLAS